MAKKGNISEIVDRLLKFSINGGVLSLGLLAPNATQAIDKPAYKYLKKIDKRQRQREVRKILQYMKDKKLIEGSYEHGLQLTDKGKARAQRAEIDDITIIHPKVWDGKWRVVMYDVPEPSKAGRDAMTRKLKDLDFYQLQKSVWVTPYECRDEIEQICAVYEIDKFVTYLETSYIDKQEIIKRRFNI